MQARNFDIALTPFREDVNPRFDTVARDHAALGSQAATKAAIGGFSLVLLLFAYEWLASGLNKLFSGDFRAGLPGQLSDAAASNPHQWYAHFLTGVAIPNAGVFTVLVELGEIAIGLGFIVAAARWFAAPRLSAQLASKLDMVAAAAMAGCAMLCANLTLMAGDPLPWLNSGDPFNEAISIDGLLTMVAIGLFVIYLLAWRADRRAAKAELGR